MASNGWYRLEQEKNKDADNKKTGTGTGAQRGMGQGGGNGRMSGSMNGPTGYRGMQRQGQPAPQHKPGTPQKPDGARPPKPPVTAVPLPIPVDPPVEPVPPIGTVPPVEPVPPIGVVPPVQPVPPIGEAPLPPLHMPPFDAAQHSQAVGDDGPVPRYDTKLHETLDGFVHEKRLERAVHVKGWGAMGYFQLQQSMSAYTAAPLFATAGQQVPVLTRFSLAVSTKGTPDTGRNVRGFSTKFYTGDGVFDLLCNHIPVFLVRDAMRFPDSIRAFLPSPKNNLGDPNRFWGFVADAPEATHFVTWLYSDVGTVKSLRHLRASSVNTYVWRNAQGQRTLVKYHWLPVAGEQYIDRKEAAALAGQNPDIAGQDLFSSIAGGTPAEYELRVQLMPMERAQTLSWDPLDCTKTWDEDQFPLQPVGRMVLNKNPDNYNEQIEKVAFSPANLQDGIEFSNDRMLQGRSTIYYDAQRYRLGPDFRQIPINKQSGFDPAALPDTGNGATVDGTLGRNGISRPDDFTQAGERYRMLTPVAQQNLVDNIASDLYAVKREIQQTVLGYLGAADADMARRVMQRMPQFQSGEAK